MAHPQAAASDGPSSVGRPSCAISTRQGVMAHPQAAPPPEPLMLGSVFGSTCTRLVILPISSLPKGGEEIQETYTEKCPGATPLRLPHPSPGVEYTTEKTPLAAKKFL